MQTEKLNIIVVQDNPTVGDLEGNSQKLFKHMAENPDADLILYPECFLTGYPLGDLVSRPGFIASVEKSVQQIRETVVATGGPAVLFGAPLASAHLPYNAAYLIEPTGAIRILRKTELPNYDVFDELRTFEMCKETPKPLMFRGHTLGIMICEDMWHGGVARSLADEMAEILIVLNGSPYQDGKQALRRKIAGRRVKETGLPLIYVNLVGGQDELVFDGASFALNVLGNALGENIEIPTWGMAAPAFRSENLDLILTRNDLGETEIQAKATGRKTFNFYPENAIENDYNAAVLGLRDYIEKTGMPHVVIGVSGGLDSALVATMAVDAVGSARVIGVMMPSEYTGEESLDLADDLMNRLGIHTATLPIGTLVKASMDSTMSAFEALGKKLGRDVKTGVTAENIQARLRGMILMGLTNAIGGIVLSTGNKSEMSVGYATLYGDMSGGFNPLKSVYKSEAVLMAEWRNTAQSLLICDTRIGTLIRDPIPEGIITRPPTAELSKGQTDAASLGDYDLLDCVLKSIIEDRADVNTATAVLIAAFGCEDIKKRTGGDQAGAYVEKISGLVRRAQYKRDQSCPGVKLNPTDFGLGWRYPIAGQYKL